MRSPDDNTPLSASELELLRLVEEDSPGDVTIPDRARVMRRDRAMLRAASIVRTPESLLDLALDRALGELDPDVLARLGEGEPVSEGIPVSGVQPERFSIVRWAFRRREALGLAATASVVLFAGWGAVLGIRALLGANPTPGVAERSPGAPATLAESTPEHTDETIAADTPMIPASDRLAMETPGDDAGGSSLTLFEAAALLREGRVMILARGASPARVAEALAGLAGGMPGPDRSFALTPGMPGIALAALGLDEIRPAAWAGDATNPPLSAALPVRSAWTATVQPSSTSLAALLDALRGAGLRVELRSTVGAIHLEPVVAPSDALWWSRPASSWRSSVAVPVVIETPP
jgi:hypothetical protein